MIGSTQLKPVFGGFETRLKFIKFRLKINEKFLFVLAENILYSIMGFLITVTYKFMLCRDNAEND